VVARTIVNMATGDRRRKPAKGVTRLVFAFTFPFRMLWRRNNLIEPMLHSLLLRACMIQAITTTKLTSASRTLFKNQAIDASFEKGIPSIVLLTTSINPTMLSIALHISLSVAPLMMSVSSRLRQKDWTSLWTRRTKNTIVQMSRRSKHHFTRSPPQLSYTAQVRYLAYSSLQQMRTSQVKLAM